jgi:hypothetical protein
VSRAFVERESPLRSTRIPASGALRSVGASRKSAPRSVSHGYAVPSGRPSPGDRDATFAILGVATLCGPKVVGGPARKVPAAATPRMGQPAPRTPLSRRLFIFAPRGGAAVRTPSAMDGICRGRAHTRAGRSRRGELPARGVERRDRGGCPRRRFCRRASAQGTHRRKLAPPLERRASHATPSARQALRSLATTSTRSPELAPASAPRAVRAGGARVCARTGARGPVDRLEHNPGAMKSAAQSTRCSRWARLFFDALVCRRNALACESSRLAAAAPCWHQRGGSRLHAARGTSPSTPCLVEHAAGCD